MAIISKTLTDSGRNATLNGLINVGAGNISGITKVSARTTSGQSGSGHTMQDITFGSISGGSVSMVGTPVLNISAGITINHIGLLAFDSGALNDYVVQVLVAIDNEVFTFAGTITITSCTLTTSATLT